MTAEEVKKELAAERAKTAKLAGELARERGENASLRQMLEEALRRLGEVEGQLAKDSHNSSEPLTEKRMVKISLTAVKSQLFLPVARIIHADSAADRTYFRTACVSSC